ncbi:MAG: S-methyl-5'-thioadenosine phosphorylase [Victivallaceae bacterium]|jgi:5'-methylthioadenosine phosphorylase
MKLGIIGGSGLYQIEGMEDIKHQQIDTPFGPPSDKFVCGSIHGVEVVFLPRHALGHPLMPGELNHRANIYAMKTLGVTHILSISAVGSLKENMKPRDVVIVDQYFDRTKRGTDHTFFGNGVVGHIAFGRPVCPELAKLATEAAAEAVKTSDNPSRVVHDNGTYVNMEGPAFSTMAESRFYRSMGWSVIGMTNLAEAKLAREAEICYCTVAMVTDYDCWHPDHDHVTVDMVIGHLVANTALSKDIIRRVAEKIGTLKRACACPNALACAIITSPDAMNPETRKKLQPIIGKYVK